MLNTAWICIGQTLVIVRVRKLTKKRLFYSRFYCHVKSIHSPITVELEHIGARRQVGKFVTIGSAVCQA